MRHSVLCERNPYKVNDFEIVKRLEDENRFITFSHVERFGINPQSNFETPLGIYAYPMVGRNGLASERLQKFDFPFAAKRKFVHIFEPVNMSTILVLQDVTDAQGLRITNAMTSFVENSPQLTSRQYMSAAGDALVWTPGGRLWYHTMKKALLYGKSRPTVAWNKLFRMVGINGCIDYNDGIIHENEPEQAVFFSQSAVRLLATLENPQTKRDVVNVRGKDAFGEFQKAATALNKIMYDYPYVTGLEINDNEDARYEYLSGYIDLAVNAACPSLNSFPTLYPTLSQIMEYSTFVDFLQRYLMIELRHFDQNLEHVCHVTGRDLRDFVVSLLNEPVDDMP
jgi:hypothetical protein